MSNECDELATVIKTAYDLNEGMATFELLAHAILAAGYSKPRTITTEEEIDALPAWSVIRSESATIWEKFGGILSDEFWAETMTLGKHPSSHIALPATVLYEPGAQS